mgnify:CR=1 FL=1
MIADVFESHGEKIEIHIISLVDHDYFSIYALDSKGEKAQGIEIRITMPFRIELLEFALQEHTRVIVSLLRSHIEQNGLEPWGSNNIDQHLQKIDVVDDVRAAGRKAFRAGRHHRINPFIGINDFRECEWRQGWMDEAEKNPGRFDFEKQLFNSAGQTPVSPTEQVYNN